MNYKVIFVLICAIGVIGANSLLLSPIAVSVGETLGQSGANVMRAASAYGVGVVISALLWAPRADRIGADRAVFQAIGLLSLSLVISAAAPTLLVLIIGQVIAGLAAGMALPGIYSLSAEIAPEGRETQTMGAVLTGWTLSMVAGVGLAAFVTDHYHWRAVYLGLAGLGFVLLIPLHRLIGVSTPREGITNPMTTFRTPGIFGGLICTCLLMFAFYISYFFMGLHIEERLGYSPTIAGLVPLIYGLGFGASTFFDRYFDRMPLRISLPLVFLFISAIYVVMAVGAGILVLLLALCFIWGISQHMGLNLMVTRLTRLDPTQRGAIMGLYATVTYLCVFAAPLIGAQIFTAYGLFACLVIAAICALCEAVEASISLRTGKSAGLRA